MSSMVIATVHGWMWTCPWPTSAPRLQDKHFADELHPNAEGAKIIAEEVFKVLAPMHKAWRVPKE